MLSTPSRKMTVSMSTSDRTNATKFGTRLKEHQKAVFVCKTEKSSLSEHACRNSHNFACLG